MKNFLIFILISVAFLGCGNETEKTVKDSVVVAQGADPKTLDPAVYNDVPSLAVAKQIYSTLVTVNKENDLVPSLATSWESISDTEWVFKLRQGVKFHNGVEMTADDVKFSIERMLEMPSSKIMVEAVEKVEKIDDYTVKIFLKNSFSPLLYNLSHPLCSILNREYTLEKGKDFGQSPLGTGPFKFEEWIQGDAVVLKAFDDYFEGRPAFTNLKFRSIPENTNRVIALETGEADIAYGIAPVDMETVEENKELALTVIPSLSTEYLGINVRNGIFKDKRVRQALNYAINKDDIIEVTLNGRGIKADTFISPNVYGSNQELHRYGFNPEKARELLKEAGIEAGTEVTIWVNENPLRVQSAQIIQANFKEVGIETSVEILEWGSYVQRTGNGEQELFIIGWNAGTGDADNALFPLFHSTSQGGAGNRSFYSSESVDKLIDESRRAQGEKRKEMLLKAQEEILGDAPLVPLFYKNIVVGVNKNLENFVPMGSGHHILKDIKLKNN